MKLLRLTSPAALSASLMVCSLSAASADCYDILGCSNTNRFSAHFDYLASPSNGPTCDYLWDMRNRIFKEHGYCFKTAKGMSQMGNEGCSIDDLTQVPLNSIERANVATIMQAEKLKRCTN